MHCVQPHDSLLEKQATCVALIQRLHDLDMGLMHVNLGFFFMVGALLVRFNGASGITYVCFPVFCRMLAPSMRA